MLGPCFGLSRLAINFLRSRREICCLLFLCCCFIVVVIAVVVASVLFALIVLRQSVFCVSLRVIWVVLQFVIAAIPGPYSRFCPVNDGLVYNTASGLKQKIQLLCSLVLPRIH